MKPIQLIACDIDGTLLHGSETKIAPAVFEQIARLHQKGIAFCPTSGRQYTSLRRLFAPVADQIDYICENGAAIFAADGTLLHKTVMPWEDALALCHAILDRPNCELLISGQNTSYLCPRQPDVVHHIRDVIHNNTVLLRKPEDVPEEIIKIAAFCRDGASNYVEAFTHDWQDRMQVAIGGARWLDFTCSDKGTGITNLCRERSIPLDAVLAIGDNYNDLPILSIVGMPYLMENAVSELLSQFPAEQRCSRVETLLATL
jgi:hypothetical protein